MKDRITILLGLYNGERYLQEQLDSFLDQRWTDWDLVVSDDGSTDRGPEIVRQFAAAHPDHDIRIVNGPRRGVAMNFLSLLAAVQGDPNYVALSDQDDVWLPEHLSQGVTLLEDYARDLPVLMGNATYIVDEHLNNRVKSPEFRDRPCFENAIVQSIAGGNTMMMNQAGWHMARDAAAEAMPVGGPKTHDWWLYQLFSGAHGNVLRDNRPTLLYRQHGGNLFGTNLGGRAAMLRARQILRGDFAEWMAMNKRALLASSHRLRPECRALLEELPRLSEGSLADRVRAFRALGLRRQGRVGQAALWLALAMKNL